jgi:hypothetical protein
MRLRFQGEGCESANGRGGAINAGFLVQRLHSLTLGVHKRKVIFHYLDRETQGEMVRFCQFSKLNNPRVFVRKQLFFPLFFFSAKKENILAGDFIYYPLRKTTRRRGRFENANSCY